MFSLKEYWGFRSNDSKEIQKGLIDRKEILKYISECFNNAEKDKQVICSIFGASGIGKTCICNQMLVEFKDKYITMPVVDFDQLENQSLISIVRKYVNTIANGFETTASVLLKYEKSTTIDKQKLYNEVISSFKRELLDYKRAQNKPICLIFDTFEKIQNTALLMEFIDIFANNSFPFRMVISGQNELERSLFKKTTFYQKRILGFTLENIKTYLNIRFSNKPIILRNTRLPVRMYELTDGSPIMCALCADWILEKPNQLEYIISLDKIDFQREIILWFQNLDEEVFHTIKHLPYVPFGINSEMLMAIFPSSTPQYDSVIDKLSTFSFIKYIESERKVMLHDEIKRLVEKNFVVGTPQKDVFFNGLISYYDRKNKSSFGFYQNRLIIEKLYCTFGLSYKPQNTFKYLEEIFLSALNSYDYELCKIILTQADIFATKFGWDSSNKVNIRVFYAELLCAQYKPEEALCLIGEIKEKTELIEARVKEVEANCIINPHTIKNRDLFKAIELYKYSIRVYLNNDILSTRLSIAYFGLGKAYICVGESERAEDSLNKALHYCQNEKDKIRILDEKSNMLRLQQKVGESKVPLDDSKILRESLKLTTGWGIYYYYLANYYRDSNDFDTAETFYIKAETALKNEGDSFKLCEAYCDHAWLEFLRTDDDVPLFKYLNKSKDLMFKYTFGTEFSEYYHILYEFYHYKADKKTAYIHLDNALKYAVEYSNIYMILDCLNHDAKRQYDTNHYDRIPKIIKQMKSYEDKGCGIRVFRGRAMLIQADIYYEETNYSQALEKWSEGFQIVAKYGNSRTNVELFEDLYRSRKHILKCCVNKLQEKGIDTNLVILKYWHDLRDTAEFSAFLQDLLM